MLVAVRAVPISGRLHTNRFAHALRRMLLICYNLLYMTPDINFVRVFYFSLHLIQFIPLLLSVCVKYEFSWRLKCLKALAGTHKEIISPHPSI